MKLTKIFAVVVAALVALTACRGTEEEQFQGDGTGFKVTASAGVIYADGTDKVVFTATFDGFALAADAITAYNKEDGNIMPLEELTFTTTVAGAYTFYFTYDKAGQTHTSEDVEVIAVEKAKLDFADNDEQGLTITASHSLFQVGVDEVYLIVRKDGKVMDAITDEEVTFYDYSDNKEIAMTTKKVTDDNGVEMYMYRYNPKEACVRTIWAGYKTLNTKNKPVKLTAVDIPIPMAAIDTDPDNTSFNRRSLLFQLTGTACPNCPRLIEVIKNLWANEKYADSFVHVGVHTYNNTDPMYYAEAGFVNAIRGVDSYPAYVLDLLYSGAHENQTFRNELDAAQAEGTKAGIAARIQSDGLTALARVSVKAAVEGEYCVAAMLVESNITATQSGDLNGEHKVHENALRLADGKNKGEYIGHSLGTLKAGEVGEYLFNMPLKSRWVQPNCHVVFYVTTPDAKGTFRVTNAIASESLNCTVEFDYK
ncbi:MAG: Omp28-related outer membrane protein [Tidjanibacter sp.]|nr:Omp28-related outer membrane protein [Tidjanibacter sp.]